MQNPIEQSDDLFKVIPGYREAVQKERLERDRAFDPDLRESILGVEVLPMSFGHLIKLSSIESPFVGRGIPSADSVMEFLWCVSVEYGAVLRLRRALSPWAPRLASWLWRNSQKRFGRKLAIKRAFVDWVEAIRKYVDDAFMDSPKGSGGGHISYLSGMAYSVKMLRDDLGMTQSQVIAMPLKQFFQHQRRIEKQFNSGAILWNPSDKLRDDWLCQQNQKPDEQRRN